MVKELERDIPRKEKLDTFLPGEILSVVPPPRKPKNQVPKKWRTVARVKGKRFPKRGLGEL